MTIREIMNMYEVADVEVYESKGVGPHFPNHFHTDNCRPIEEYDINQEHDRILYEAMDEDEYNQTMLANASVFADFEGWYGDKNAKVLCIMIEPEQ